MQLGELTDNINHQPSEIELGTAQKEEKSLQLMFFDCSASKFAIQFPKAFKEEESLWTESERPNQFWKIHPRRWTAWTWQWWFGSDGVQIPGGPIFSASSRESSGVCICREIPFPDPWDPRYGMSMPLANPMEAMICYQKWYDEGFFIPLELRSEMSPKFKGFICDLFFGWFNHNWRLMYL